MGRGRRGASHHWDENYSTIPQQCSWGCRQGFSKTTRSTFSHSCLCSSKWPRRGASVIVGKWQFWWTQSNLMAALPRLSSTWFTAESSEWKALRKNMPRAVLLKSCETCSLRSTTRGSLSSQNLFEMAINRRSWKVYHPTYNCTLGSLLNLSMNRIFRGRFTSYPFARDLKTWSNVYVLLLYLIFKLLPVRNDRITNRMMPQGCG